MANSKHMGYVKLFNSVFYSDLKTVDYQTNLSFTSFEGRILHSSDRSIFSTSTVSEPSYRSQVTLNDLEWPFNRLQGNT